MSEVESLIERCGGGREGSRGRGRREEREEGIGQVDEFI